jgi:2-enoate reductase
MGKNYQKVVEDLIEGLDGRPRTEEHLSEGRMTGKLFPYEHLFSPIQINNIKLKNRIVMGPMGNVGLADETGRPGNKMIQYFVERAKGGVGLITSGLVLASNDVEASVIEPGDLSLLPRIDRSRTVYPGWRILAESIHAYGARFFIQISPGLGRVASPECLIKKLRLPVSASWNPNFYLPSVPCRPLRDDECLKIIKNAGQAAADAKSLLIDGVYLHGHEGYLLEQMVNPAFNRRKIGRFSNWQTFGIELVKHIRQRVGESYPIMYRIDISLALNETYGKRMAEVSSLKKFRKERTVEMTLEYMANLVKAGVDMFDVDLGCYDNWWLPHPPTSMPPGCYLPIAKLVKDYLAEKKIKSNAGLPVPVVAVGKLGYPDLAERSLSEGMCDMVMLARPLLADPEWPAKAYAGRISEICPCIGDQEACLNEFIEGGHPQCAVNPRTGFEDIMYPLTAASKTRKVAVVGSGPAGVLCACTAAQHGHKVTLFERLDKAGGQLVPGSVPQFKYDVANYLQYLRNMLQNTTRSHDLNVRMQTEATPELLKGGEYDVVVTCTGGRPVKPAVDGIDLPNVVQAVDLLRSGLLAARAQKLIVIGGGSVGCELAYMLACEKGKQVTIVEMLPYFMKGVCTANRGHLIHNLEKANVSLLNCAELKSVGPLSVNILKNVSPTVPDPYNTWSPIVPENVRNPLAKKMRIDNREIELEADLVVLAVGLKADDRFYEECVRERVAEEIYNVGDSFSVGRVFEATRAGYAVGSKL